MTTVQHAVTQTEAAAAADQASEAVPVGASADIVLYVGKRPTPEELIRGVIVSENPDSQAVANELRQLSEAKGRVDRIGGRLGVDFDEVLDLLEQITGEMTAGASKPAEQLSAHDAAVLREAGLPVDGPSFAVAQAPARAALEYARLLSTSLTVKAATERLHVSEGRIRQRLADRTLYGFQWRQSWRIPVFQFGPGGALQGLDAVLQVLPEELDPLSVEGFFTIPNVDLEIDGEPASVIEWLAAGRRPGAAVAVATNLFRST